MVHEPSTIAVQDSSDSVIANSGSVPSDGVPNQDNKDPIFEIHVWFKGGYESRGLPAVTRDPATGKHFYTSDGIKVFVH